MQQCGGTRICRTCAGSLQRGPVDWRQHTQHTPGRGGRGGAPRAAADHRPSNVNAALSVLPDVRAQVQKKQIEKQKVEVLSSVEMIQVGTSRRPGTGGGISPAPASGQK